LSRRPTRPLRLARRPGKVERKNLSLLRTLSVPCNRDIAKTGVLLQRQRNKGIINILLARLCRM
jgi:hypothetical protein